MTKGDLLTLASCTRAHGSQKKDAVAVGAISTSKGYINSKQNVGNTRSVNYPNFDLLFFLSLIPYLVKVLITHCLMGKQMRDATATMQHSALFSPSAFALSLMTMHGQHQVNNLRTNRNTIHALLV